VLRIEVPGSLRVDGRISADGLDGSLDAGGGAGGSIWMTVGTLSGSGKITANGGAGLGSAGGGGGGRLAVTYSLSDFSGTIEALGGPGLTGGGAGTVYINSADGALNRLLIENAGLAGTNTPLSSAYRLPPPPFDLVISGGAGVQPLTPLPLLSNLMITAGSSLTLPPGGPTNLALLVLKNLQVASGGLVSATAHGYGQGLGPGAGSSSGGDGAGGGYGGMGGTSISGAAGGAAYGSLTQPIDQGSGGGAGTTTYTSGSEGGGAIRLSVGGVLTVNGALTADGDAGLQDNSGGGSGGSIWISASTLAGSGWISASGGSGELYGGGGGAGGRIAIYSPANSYTGVVFTAAAPGANFGQSGSVFESDLPAFQVTSQFPSGAFTNLVGRIELTFSDVINPLNLSAAGFTLYTPAGPLPGSSMILSVPAPSTLRFQFPAQNLVGDYQLVLRSGVTSLLGQALPQVYTGSFSVTLPVVSGTVTDTNGQPVAGVLMQSFTWPAGAVVTDSNGTYSVGVPRGWYGRVTPAFANSMFIPSQRTYLDLTLSATNQNYVMVGTIAPQLTATVTTNNFSITWQGLAGVSYRVWWSTNLTYWQPYGAVIYGSNNIIELPMPSSGQSFGFVRVQASD
jgi:hypothetical protein